MCGCCFYSLCTPTCCHRFLLVVRPYPHPFLLVVHRYISEAPNFRCSSCNTCDRGPSGTGSCQAYYRRGGECLKCPNMAWVLILLFIVVALGCCLAGYFLSRKQVNLAFLSIGVDYFQILAIFANSKVGPRRRRRRRKSRTGVFLRFLEC